MRRPVPTPWSRSSATTTPRPPSTVRRSASADLPEPDLDQRTKNMFHRKNTARLAGVVGAAAVTVGMLSTGAANADTFIPLPGGEIVKTMSDGPTVTVRLSGESDTLKERKRD